MPILDWFSDAYHRVLHALGEVHLSEWLLLLILFSIYSGFRDLDERLRSIESSLAEKARSFTDPLDEDDDLAV